MCTMCVCIHCPSFEMYSISNCIQRGAPLYIHYTRGWNLCVNLEQSAIVWLGKQCNTMKGGVCALFVL